MRCGACAPAASLARRVLERAAATIILALASCGGHLRYDSEETVSGKVPVPPGTTRIVVRVPAGALEATPGAPGEVAFDGHVLRAADTEADLQRLQALAMTLQPSPGEVPGELVLTAPGLPTGCSPEACRLVIPLVLRVPPDVALELQTPIGDCAVNDHRGDVTIETRYGDVNLRRCEGRAEVRVPLKGDVVVDSHRGSLDLETARGSLIVDVADLRDPGLRLRSMDGTIKVFLPADAPFTLDARTATGNVVDQFGLTRGARDATRKVLQGQVRGGGPKVDVQTERGGIDPRPRG